MSDTLNPLASFRAAVRSFIGAQMRRFRGDWKCDDDILTHSRILVRRDKALLAGHRLGVNPLEMGRFLDSILSLCWSVAFFAASGLDEGKKESAFSSAVEQLETAMRPLRDLLICHEDAAPQQTPSSERLRLRLEDGQLYLGDEHLPLNLSSERRGQALVFLGYLIAARGNWVSGGDIDKAERQKNGGEVGIRWDQVFKRLKESASQLSLLIESCRSKGYRLRK